MGQDTHIDYGVSVTLDLSNTNIQLIKKLLDAKSSPNKYHSYIKCYVTGLLDCNDEISEMNYDAIDNTSVVDGDGDSYSDEENKYCKQSYINYLTANPEKIKEKSKIQYHFLIECCNAYARNISRRCDPYIFMNDKGLNPMILGRRLQKSRKAFLQLGVDKKRIEMGYTFMDSY